MTDRTLPASQVAELVAEVIRTDPTTETALGGDRLVTGERLAASPLHPGVELVRLVVHLPHPGPAFVCARVTEGLVLLRNPASMNELNRSVGLQLRTADEVITYLGVWFALVDPTRGRPVTSPDDVPWAPSLLDLPGAPEAMGQASALVHPMRVEEIGGGRFRVVATVLERRTLQSRVLEVAADGAVEVVTSTDLLDELPVRAAIR